MLPNNKYITPVPAVSDYSFPLSDPYTPLSYKVKGGVALGDPSKGRSYKVWQVRYVSGVIEVNPIDEPIAVSLAIPDVRTVSIAFDNNMAVVIAYQTSNGSYLYYRDSVANQYITLSFLGYTSCRVAVDDPRDLSVFQANSDVIFAYTRDNGLYYRQQRDRYLIEYYVGPTTKKIIKLGLNSSWRFQFGLATT